MAQGPRDGARDDVGAVAIRQYGKYFLVKKLAEGGMAEIFLAKQLGVERFEKNVVVKRMLAHLSGVQDFVSMFLDEARLAATLAHHNVVQILDLGLEEGCYFIAMEYLAGEDFSTVIRAAAKRGKYVPLSVVMKVVADAAHGLNFAHEVVDAKGNKLNIVHRDVSPSNIFVTYNGQVKMLDFGIAKAESRVTNTTAGIVKGKYQYMSPEQASSMPVDRRSDVYSLGVCLYEAVTNTRPFARESDLAILNAVLRNEYRPPLEVRPDLPLEVVQIITKALSPVPETRYQSALELATDIETFLRSHSTASNGKALGHYMSEFFGDERVQSKTRIDTLDELQTKAGMTPASTVETTTNGHQTYPEVPIVLTGIGASPAESTKPEGGTSAALPRSVVEARKSNRSTLLAIAGAVLFGVLATVIALKLLAKPEAPMVNDPVVDSGPKVVTPPFPTAVSGADAGPDVQGADAGPVQVTVPDVADAGAAPAIKKPPPGPTTLTTSTIVGVVRKNSAALYKCFKEFEADLPEASGTINLTFTIGSSGKVEDAHSAMPGKSVGRCLESRMRAIRFPAHVDKEVTATLPLQYQRGR